MDLRVGIAGAHDEVGELHSLYEAILEDGELRPASKALEHGQPAADEMGADEVIRVILDPDLVSAVAAASRPGSPRAADAFAS